MISSMRFTLEAKSRSTIVFVLSIACTALGDLEYEVSVSVSSDGIAYCSCTVLIT